MLDITLMIVEDDTQLLETLRKILAREVRTVYPFDSSQEAIDSFERCNPDIIITDIKMAGLSGLEMIHIIKEKNPKIPVIVISAFSESVYFIEAIELKVNHFLTKPVNINELLEMLQDITAELELRYQLQEKQRVLDQYKRIVDLSSNITITDIKGRITYVNDKFCTLSGYSREELLGQKHNIVRHPDMPTIFYKILWKTILSKKVWQGTIKNRGKNGKDFYVETTIAPILDKDDNIEEFISMKVDITPLILNKKQLQAQIITDKLTNLPNRIKLHEDVRTASNKTLIVFDINHFKEINLLFGVKLGDEALIYVADRLLELMKGFSNAVLYRISADEFTILKDGNCIDEFTEFAYKVKSFIDAHPFAYKDITFDIDFTCAIAYKQEKTKLILESALEALDNAKDGKYFLRVYDKAYSKQLQYEQNFQWTKKIKEALLDNRIQAYYQPIYSIFRAKISKYECLVRLIDEDGTIVAPYLFLPMAKRSRLYKEITKTVINQACEVFAKRKETITINFSIEDLLDKNTVDYFISMVEKNSMQGRVVAEVLESEGIENFEVFRDVLNRLNANGIRIAIDDFGSGYSNFSYFVHLHIDILKIDGSLIKNINTDPNAAIIVRSIVMFAREIGMKTVAEFVCDKDIYESVKGFGIDYIQGYYIAQPMPEPLEGEVVLDL